MEKIRMKVFLTALGFILLTATAALAAPLTLDRAASSVTFSGTHAGNPFTGTFQNWSGDVSFDPADLAASRAKITFDLTSASTGDKMYDGTLPQADWFDVKNTPTATFESTSVVSGVAGYRMTGILDLRGVKKEISFDFQIQETAPPTVTATIPINRMDFNIGAKSDPKAEWVGDVIEISLKLKAM